MKRLIGILGVLTGYVMGAVAQNVTNQSPTLTAYPDFKPAVVTFKDGKKINVKQANIFLKNSTLLYKHGTQNLQAKMDNISTVDFADRHYEHVDSVGTNKLLCTSLLDMETFQRQMANNREITHLDLGEIVSITTTELKTAQDNGYPIYNRYLFQIDGKLVKAQDRPCLRIIPKDRRREYKNILGSANFNWNNPQCLKQILLLITKE